MMKAEIMCLSYSKWCIFLTILILPPATPKQYRTDYVYNKVTDAFYKFHLEDLYFTGAQQICAFEGATLMVPRSDEDISQAHGMFKPYPDIGDLAWIGTDGYKHETDEEIPLIMLGNNLRPSTYETSQSECDVIKRNGETRRFTTCSRRFPFICKVEAKDAFEDKQCSVFGQDYRYFENVGSCYKIPKLAFEWNQAYSECRAEGAHLVVLNSEMEHQVVRNFTNEEHLVKNTVASWFFYAGIRAEKTTDGSPIVFKTIFNQTLEEAGYSQWGENEPNNARGDEYCGSIFKGDGKYNDIECATHKYGFICEKEVKNT